MPDAPDTRPAPSRRGPGVRTVIVAIVAVVLVGALAAIVWLATPYPAHDTAFDALETSATVTVTDVDGLISFRPHDSSDTGLILYPGGRVAVEAYAPLARRVADAGHLVVLVRMPVGLAVLDADAASRVIAEEAGAEVWIVGGHSLGGAMAARFAERNPARVSGLVLLAAYPPSSTDLSNAELAVVSVRGTEDGLVTVEDVDESRRRLPATARFVVLPGGNHAGFGEYGPQQGDGTARLPSDVQQEATAREIIAVLEEANRRAVR